MFFSLYKFGLAKIERWIKVRVATFKWITVYSQLVSTYNQVLIRGQLTKYENLNILSASLLVPWGAGAQKQEGAWENLGGWGSK